MGSTLPPLSLDQFAARIDRAVETRQNLGLDDEALRPAWRTLLWQHYEEMRRWNPRLSLVGPGTAAEVVERHYVESLCALPLLPPKTEKRPGLLDVGTGGGFPGFVLALLRPDLDVVLMDPNQRKCAFLAAALRRVERHLEAGIGDGVEGGIEDGVEDVREPVRALSCTVLNARVERPSPHGSAALRAASPQPSPDDNSGEVLSGRTIDLITSRALAWTRDIHRALLDHWPAARFLLWVGQDDPELPDGATLGRRISLASSRRIVEIQNRA